MKAEHGFHERFTQSALYVWKLSLCMYLRVDIYNASLGFQPSGMTPQHMEMQPSVRASIENLEELKQDT